MEVVSPCGPWLNSGKIVEKMWDNPEIILYNRKWLCYSIHVRSTHSLASPQAAPAPAQPEENFMKRW
jgi:hypothetical protein